MTTYHHAIANATRAVARLILMIRTTGGGTRRGCPQGYNLGKMKFNRNIKIDRGVGDLPRNLLVEKVGTAKKI